MITSYYGFIKSCETLFYLFIKELSIIMPTLLGIFILFTFLDTSEPKWVNSILYIIWVNSLRPGGLHIKKELRRLVKPGDKIH